MLLQPLCRWAARAALAGAIVATVGCGGSDREAKSAGSPMGDATRTTEAAEMQSGGMNMKTKDDRLDEDDSAPKHEMLADAPPRPMFAQNQPAPQPPPPPGQAGQPGPPPAAKKAPDVAKGPKSGTEVASDVARMQSPMLLYTAQITMAVFEVKKALAEVEALGRDVGGFLARRDDQTITIRVPAARFDETVHRLEKMGDMIHRNVTAEDVTEEFHDLEVRLKSARAVRERLEQLLAKAAKVEESVLIERELERVGGEIERLEGRLKFLRDRAAYSTITVSFQPRRSETVGNAKFNLPVPWLYELGLSRLLAL